VFARDLISGGGFLSLSVIDNEAFQSFIVEKSPCKVAIRGEFLRGKFLRLASLARAIIIIMIDDDRTLESERILLAVLFC
jgi:hypothetical protein